MLNNIVDKIEQCWQHETLFNAVFNSPEQDVRFWLCSEKTYSWVSRDVIISLGVNSKSMHSNRREIVFHCMC